MEVQTIFFFCICIPKSEAASSSPPHRVASTSPPPSPISICKYSLFTFCIQNTLYTKRKKTREGRGKRSCFAGGLVLATGGGFCFSSSFSLDVKQVLLSFPPHSEP